jgi:exopolysaccharide biosynthesis protein
MRCIEWFTLAASTVLFGCPEPDDGHGPPPDDDTTWPSDDDSAGGLADDDDTTQGPPPYNGCGVHRDGERGPGTWSEPIEVPYLPFFDRNDTTASAVDLADVYDCATDLGEQGPEIVYRFVTERPGTFRAEVDCAEPIDIDLHLLQAPEIVAGEAQGCIARAHIELEVTGLDAGEYWLVADSWSDDADEYAGAYEVAFEWIADDVWSEVPVAEGLTWSRLRSPDLAGGDQTVNVLRVTADASLDVQPSMHGGCLSVPAVAADLDALAAVNAGFFASGCAPLDMIKADGVLYATNTCTGGAQRTLGWTHLDGAGFDWIDTGMDWPEVANAVGGHPSLVTGGAVDVDPYDGSNSFYTSRHPRSAMGLTADGDLLLVTVDGRTAAGDGMTCEQTAQLMLDLGAVHAVNLDGGGSTTMVVRDCWIGDVVNHPSDNGEADHHGERSVSDGIYLR